MNPRPATVRPIVWWMLAAVTIGLRIWGLDHGLPRNFVPDTTVVRAALSLGAGTNPFAGEALPTQYPYLLPYLLAAVFGALYVGGRLGGWFPTLEAFESFALDRPEIFFVLARAVVALAGCGVVLLVVLCARRLGSDRAGLLAGWLTATSLILVQLSHQARPHMVTAFFLMLCLWAVLVWQDSMASGADSHRAYIFAWWAAAAAGATTPYGFLGLLIPATAWWRHQRPGRRLGKSTAVALLGTGLLSVVCYPRLLLRPEDSFGYDPGTGLVHYFDGLLVAPEFINGGGFEQLAAWLMSYEPVCALLLVPACAVLLRDRSGLDRWAPLLVYPAVFLCVYGMYEVIHPRYLVSLVPFIALIIGPLANLPGPSRAGARGALGPGLLLIAAGLVLIVPLVQAARLDLLLSREDTRLAAEAWIEQNIPAGQVLAIEAHGVAPEPDMASLRRMAESHGDQLGVKDARRLRANSGGGRALHRLWPDADYRSGSIDQLDPEIRWIAVVVQGGIPRTDPFYRSLSQPPRARFSPIAAGPTAPEPVGAVETNLPAELQDPLLGLWRVERCGPVVELYHLAGALPPSRGDSP